MKAFEGVVAVDADRAQLKQISESIVELRKENDVVIQLSKDLDALGY